MEKGHKEHDVLFVYSIEKVNRYYEDIVDRENVFFYSETVRDYYVGMATPPAPSQKYAQAQRKAWDKYIQSIHPDNLKDKAKKKKNPLKALMQLETVPKVIEHINKADSKESDDK